MRNIFLCVLLFHFSGICCFAQVGGYGLTAKKDSLRLSPGMHENKAIGLSGLTADTLTWSQFTYADAITVKDKQTGEEISMYRLSIFMPNKDIQEYVQWNDYLSDYTIREIIATGVKKIMISDVTLTRGRDQRNAGYRWFYFK